MDNLDTQAAGHKFFHEADGGNLLMKEFDSHEFLLYYIVQRDFKNLLPFIPDFRGVYKSTSCKMDESVRLDMEKVYKSIGSNIEEKPIRDPSLFIAMVNGSHGMKHPCTLDIKLGRQNLDFWASGERNHHIQEKCEHCTTGSHALRLEGRVRWIGEDGDYKKDSISKAEGRKLTFDELSKSIRDYFTCPSGSFDSDLAIRVGSEIQKIYEAFSSHTYFSFYSSSLLVIYDAEDHSKLYVKIIDFGRAIKNSLIKVERDENLMEGLKNLLMIFNSFPKSKESGEK